MPAKFYIKTVVIYILIIPHLITSYSDIATYRNGSIEANLNFTELTAKYGYKSEEHTVVTEDGYLLTIFRIVHARKCDGVKKSPPVLLEHGLLLSSDAFLDSGPESGLGYLLADACYDLWVGNQRGNYYGRRHLRLRPDIDPSFWEWTVDQIGYYDIPATINYVLEYTGAPQLNYIGYSQGCGTFYIMCSERPEYNNKVKLKISIAPATRHLNTKSVGFRGINVIFDKFLDLFEAAGIYEALPRGGVVQTAAQKICSFDKSYPICIAILAFFDSFNPGSIDGETVKSLTGHFPGGTSSMNLARYGQAMTSVEFQKYDYGLTKNLKVYGSVFPPVYNLSRVTVPVLILYGDNDGIVDKEDVRYAARRLSNVLEMYRVEDPFWTHFDNGYSQFVPKRIFAKINEYLSLYSYW